MASLAVHLFFRRIDVEAPHHLPGDGPVLIVANHSNALVDPLVIVTAVHRRITVTAKHALADNVMLRWIMSMCGVITFRRQQDARAGASPRENLRSLQQCQVVLARGGAICIFPEGVSHSDSRLRAFRHGAARIALQYARSADQSGPLRVVPVGLLYTAKDRFRSDVWLRFGEPLDMQRWLTQNPEATPADLTRVIEQQVATLTINTPRRREQYLLTWAAEIVATGAGSPRPLGSDDSSVAQWFQLISRLQAGWSWLDQHHPDVPRQLARRIRGYRHRLRRAGITPHEVYLPLHPGRAAFFLLREFELMLLGGPLALFGALNHAAPYGVVKWIATKLSRDQDHWASNAIFPSFVVFPCFYLVQLVAAWLLLPTLWASLYTIALPYTGYYAVLYGDRFQRAWRRARTFVRLARSPAEQQQLAMEGRGIVREIRAVGQLIERETLSGGVSP
jgi:1-acyl-sn-glycerol-3-phosphate acyltransferase